MGSRCNPDYLMQCGCCCFILSLWGAIQLSVMGWLYYFESTPLVQDVLATEYTYYVDFILLTKLNFYETALNCCYAVIIYCFTGILSLVCIVVARYKKKRELKDADDDDLFCGIPEKERQMKLEKPLELKSPPESEKPPLQKKPSRHDRLPKKIPSKKKIQDRKRATR